LSITVVSSTYNCRNEILDTIRNIRRNLHLGIQWIVVDGCSTDGTIEVLRNNDDLIDVFISEPDTGIYDAWNKSLRYITGEWVVFLGAGDIFLNDGLKQALNILASVNGRVSPIVYFNVRLVNENNRCLKTYTFTDKNDWKNGRPDLPCHQGVFQHKSLFSQQNVFDQSYRIAADSKFLLNVAANFDFRYYDIDLSCMRVLGVSTDPMSILKVTKELTRLRNELGLKMPFFKWLAFTLKCNLKFILIKTLGRALFSLGAKVYCKVMNKDNLY
jgi:glycosyltransferase involved in cell wall biosynthesis